MTKKFNDLNWICFPASHGPFNTTQQLICFLLPRQCWGNLPYFLNPSSHFCSEIILSEDLLRGFHLLFHQGNNQQAETLNNLLPSPHTSSWYFCTCIHLDNALLAHMRRCSYSWAKLTPFPGSLLQPILLSSIYLSFTKDIFSKISHNSPDSSNYPSVFPPPSLSVQTSLSFSILLQCGAAIDHSFKQFSLRYSYTTYYICKYVHIVRCNKKTHLYSWPLNDKGITGADSP